MLSRIQIKKGLIFLFLVSKVPAAVEYQTSVMTYNLENLFDNVHDPGKDDETYLPRNLKNNPQVIAKCKKIPSYYHRKECFNLDWNDEALYFKLKNLSDRILSVENGKGPDSLIVTEVENKAILTRLNDHFLKAAHYQTLVLIEGNDPRGIDIGFLSRYPIADTPKLHPIVFSPRGKDDQRLKELTELNERTRGILDVKIKLANNQNLHFLAVHFPSQAQPAYIREQALEALKTLILKYKNDIVIAGGDFNIISTEERNKKFLKTILRPLGKVSHLDACETCVGSYWYRNKWSFLDILFFSNTLFKRGWQLDAPSVMVVNQNKNFNQDQKPVRYDPIKKICSSDHFPVYARLKWKKSLN